MGEWDRKRRITKHYDATAGIYESRYAQDQTAKMDAALKNVKIEKCGCVLDAGCGTGILLDFAGSHATAIVGVDISRKALAEAKTRAKKYANVHLIWADVDYMPVKNGVFDSVFAMTVLQNVPSPRKTLAEINFAAKHDAIIVVTGLKKVFERECFQRLLKDAGLDVVAFEDEGLECYVAVCSRANLRMSSCRA
jgi:ubiquinone/menaquinone biosynthesis C-methylase UbiE